MRLCGEPITRNLVATIETFADANGIDLIRFEKGERNDDRTQAYLRQGPGDEVVLHIGRRRKELACCAPKRRSIPPPATGLHLAGLLHRFA